MSLAIVIPTRNEFERLLTKIPDIKEVFPEAEILIVNTPVENDKTKELTEFQHIKYVESKERFGKCLVYGLYLCKGFDFVITMDADHDPNSAKLMYDAIKDSPKYDLAIGVEDSKRIQRDVVNVFLGLLADVDQKNPTCGLRCYRGSVIPYIIPEKPDDWFFIQIQLLYYTLKFGRMSNRHKNVVEVSFPAAEHTGITENAEFYKKFVISFLKFFFENI